MESLGIDFAEFLAGFSREDHDSLVVLTLAPDQAATWASNLTSPIRRCYITDEALEAAIARTGRSRSEIITSKLPSPGSVMSGDFGEFIAAFYLASREEVARVRDPIKWRYKNDASKPAPYSDVVQFVLPSWPVESSQDKIVCAEVKAKATKGGPRPIEEAIKGSEKDRNGRLAKTLVWLKALALDPGLAGVEVALVERFIRAIDHPDYVREFVGVAIVSSELTAEEIGGPDKDIEGIGLIVIAVPELKTTYTKVFERVATSADDAQLKKSVKA